ncbi:MAG: rRNA ((1915)-N(3))-methyltransferase RlmH [Bacteroidota bacterium]
MKIEFWCVGKTTFGYLEEGIMLYDKRLRHYATFERIVIPDIKNPKNLSVEQIKEQEGSVILQRLQNDDFLVLLDERGKQFSSEDFADLLGKWQVQSLRRVVFVVGGAYGFSEAVYNRQNMQISLSRMTFSHQMVRLFFVEQLYRGFTILRGEPYHHS